MLDVHHVHCGLYALHCTYIHIIFLCLYYVLDCLLSGTICGLESENGDGGKKKYVYDHNST